MNGGETLLKRRKKTVRFSKEETLLFLRAFKEHPTRWADVLADVKENLDRLPDAARDLYTNGSSRELMDRMSAKLGKMMATREHLKDEGIRREVDLIRENERRHIRNIPAAPGPQPDDVLADELNNQDDDDDQPAAADRKAVIAAAISDTEYDVEPVELAAEQPSRRRRRLADLRRENHELYNDFMKRKMPRLLRHFGLDSESDT